MKSGLVPYNPNVPLASDYAMSQENQNLHQTQGIIINGNLITTKDFQVKLMSDHFKMNASIETLNYYNQNLFRYGIFLQFIKDSKHDGFLLSELPELWIEKNGGFVGAISSEDDLIKA